MQGSGFRLPNWPTHKEYPVLRKNTALTGYKYAPSKQWTCNILEGVKV